MESKDLKTNPKNPRTITTSQFEKLKTRIKELTKMLEVRPIAFDEDGVIWGGNMRYLALRALVDAGLVEDNPNYYKELKGWTQKEKEEFAISDNVEFGEWDENLLANEWTHLALNSLGVWTGEEKIESEELDPTKEQKEPKLEKCPKCGHEFEV